MDDTANPVQDNMQLCLLTGSLMILIKIRRKTYAPNVRKTAITSSVERFEQTKIVKIWLGQPKVCLRNILVTFVLVILFVILFWSK